MHNQNIQDLGKDKYGRTVHVHTCHWGRKHYYINGVIQDEPPVLHAAFPPEWKMQRIHEEGEPLPKTVYIHRETGDEWEYQPEF